MKRGRKSKMDLQVLAYTSYMQNKQDRTVVGRVVTALIKQRKISVGLARQYAQQLLGWLNGENPKPWMFECLNLSNQDTMYHYKRTGSGWSMFDESKV